MPIPKVQKATKASARPKLPQTKRSTATRQIKVGARVHHIEQRTGARRGGTDDSRVAVGTVRKTGRGANNFNRTVTVRFDEGFEETYPARKLAVARPAKGRVAGPVARRAKGVAVAQGLRGRQRRDSKGRFA